MKFYRLQKILDRTAVEKLSVKRGWRIRLGDWRIGYEINDSEEEITVIRVGHRREFYD